ncbi:MAG TPA: DUF3375 domain-containing protein [Epsilonproteobacteria bacterium]|nr:DUF3375 domain-containing protein [Campylobacterota bacterium]
MTYEYLKNLKATNQTLKLLNSDNFAMTLSFFRAVFTGARETTLPQSRILQQLDDYLYLLNQSYDGLFPRPAQAYLDDFAASGFLRKYYADADEPVYELTPQSQKALEWIESLEKREFVGSRSRFNLIFELLEELEFETGMDDKTRIAKLEAQKLQIDEEIEAIRSRRSLRFDESRIREHYMEIEEIARRLTYDFAQIEYNFRELNTTAMEQIAMRDDAKGEVLGSIFELEDAIRESDQGKSFFAFWQLLTDAQRSEKLSQMLEGLYEIPSISAFDSNRRLKNLKYDLLKSGEKIATVTSRLIEQLRRFIDDRVWIENRRILQLCKAIEKQALEIKEQQPKTRSFVSIPGQQLRIRSIAGKSLYRIRTETSLKQEIVEKEVTIDLESFYHQCYVDEEKLRRQIQEMLQHRQQCSLCEVAAHYGVDKGVAELIGYLSIAKNSHQARIETEERERIPVTDFDGEQKVVILPKIIFTRRIV